MHAGKRIGDLNGKWAFGLKIAIATYPIFVTAILSWGTWVTVQTFASKAFRESGDRFTQLDGANLRADMVKNQTEILLRLAHIEEVLRQTRPQQ